MKKIVCFLCFIISHCVLTAHSQNVVVSGAHASSNGSYATLKLAFDAINGQDQMGSQVMISVDASTTETASAVLNAGNWTTLRIFPSVSGVSISGNLAAPLVDLNGASNVVFDGRVNAVSAGTPYSLTLRNTNTTNTVGTSTLRFINGASNDTVRFVQLEGSGTVATSGTVFFSTSTAVAGNNNNILLNNRITNAGGNRPVNSVYSSGTSAKLNTGNVVRGNEVFNIFHPNLSSQGILLESFNANWRLEGNSFYETGSLAPTTTAIYSTIWVNNTGVNGTVIRGNFIGGTQAQAGGAAFTKTNSSSNPFYGIRINAGTVIATQVDSNMIRNMSWTNSSGNAWYGIDVAAGLVDIGLQEGNRIGGSLGGAVLISQTSPVTISNVYGINLSGSGGLRVRRNVLSHLSLTTAITGSNLHGIHITATGTIDVDTNTISHFITSTTASSIACHLYGIISKSALSVLNIRGNVIGSATLLNNLHTMSQSTNNDQYLYGIRNESSGSITMSGNTISNLTNATTNPSSAFLGLVQGIASYHGTNLIENNIIRDLQIANANNNQFSFASLAGILLTNNTLKTVRGNIIHNLRNTFTNFTGHIYGVYFTGGTGTNNGVYRNFIHTLESPNNTGVTASNIYGIRQVSSGVATFANNIVTLQGTNTAVLHGFYDDGISGTSNFYHNTIYIGGTAGATSSAASYGLWSNASGAIEDYRNNILVNVRTGGTGVHYGIRLAANTTLTIDQNTYHVSGSGVLGRMGTTDHSTLASWQVATGQDIMSGIVTPQFANGGGLTATNYIPAATTLVGTPYLNITDDFSGATRQYFSRGAYDVFTDNLYVTVNATAGVPTQNYFDLTQAFNRINDGSHRGQIDVIVNLSHSLIQTATMNASGSGAANYSGVRVYPNAAGLVVSGNLALPLVDLNGASNVAIDGRVGGAPAGAAYGLTFRNTNTSATAGTSTVRFINGAHSDTLQFARIEGSNTSTVSGTILFSTSTAANGNNNNVIRNNQITHANGNRPVNALYSAGTTTKENTANVIRDNEFFDFLSTIQSSQAILLESHNTHWSILGNSFYQTVPLAPANTWNYGCIHINNTNHQGGSVRGNFIGGTQAMTGGAAFTKTNISRNAFYGIRLNVGNLTAIEVDSNIIQNISWSNNSGADWVGIDVIAGNANIGVIQGNKVGSTGAGIQVSSNTTTLFNVYGVALGGSGTIQLRNNTIENISMTSGVTGSRLVGILATSTGTVLLKDNIIRSLTTNTTNTTFAAHLYGIHKTGSGTFTAEDNMVGSLTTPNSLFAQSLSTDNAQEVIGIVNLNAGTLTFRGNTIAHLTNATNAGTSSISGYTHGITSVSGVNLIENNTIQNLTIANSNINAVGLASVGGIILTGSSLKTVRGNTISNLQNTFTNFAGHIYGIYFTGSNGVDNGVYKNFIHSLSAPNNTSTTAANIYGIRNASVSGVTANIENNIVSLQGSQTAVLYGIFDNANVGVGNVYHNTIYLGGVAGAGSAASYGFWSDGTSTRDYRNNVLVNERSGGTGPHYAIRIAGTTGLTINHNLYRVGVSGITGLFTSNRTTLSDWQTATGQDAMSLNVNPQFTLAGGSTANDYIPAANSLVGFSSLAVNDDYANNPRVYRSMGAFDVITLNPVEVLATSGIAQATYDNLTTAFARINDGTHKGQIRTIVHVSHPLAQSAVLNANGSGAANYSSIRIYPSNTSLVVSGNLAAPLIDLNGASNVTIDGRVGGNASGASYALTLSNTSVSATAGTSTLRFINGASTDTVQFVQLEGSNTLATSGTVFFSTSTAVAGNNNNVLLGNRITNASSNRPVNTIYSSGTLAKSNTGNILRDNAIFDFFRPISSSQGVLLEANNSDWRIEGNSFYETGSLAPNAAHVYSTIWVNNTGVNGTVIRGNFIGGTQPQAGGTAFTKTSSSSNPFYAIRVNAGTTSATQVDSNVVGKITWTNSTGNNWFGIDVAAGLVDIGVQRANQIGGSGASIVIDQTTATTISNVYGMNLAGSGNIRVRHNSLSHITLNTPITGSNFWGIHTVATGAVDIDSNTISNITTSGANATLAANLYGIYKNATAGNLNIRGNTIGSTTVANSLHASSASTSNAQLVYGIQNLGIGTVTISGNIIGNLTNATTNTNTATLGALHGIVSSAGTNIIENNVIRHLTISNANNSATNTASLAGIMLTGGSVKTVLRNTIYNLENTFTNFTGHIYGIYFTGNTGANNGVFRNFIHSLSAPNNLSTIAANIYGIRQVPNGSATIANNIIALQGSQTAFIHGLYDNGSAGSSNYYHNTIYIGGTATNGSAASYGLWSNAATASQDYRNNILVNERTGGTGTHYAIRLAGNTSLNINHNLYKVGLGGVLGWLGINRITLQDWQAATLQDQSSVSLDPQFAQPGGIQANDYIPSANTLVGFTGLSISDDYTGALRTYRNMGAFDVITLSPVEVLASSGITQALYSDLTTAFARINDGTHQGDVQTIVHVSHPLVQSALLSASGVGGANYSRVKVYPSAASLVVSGNLAAPLIDLNGATNVVFDGRVGGVSSGAAHGLTLRNNNTGNIAGTSTLRLINGASMDTVQFVRLEGSSTSEVAGIIFFSTSSAGNGNNDNVIRHNLVTNALGNRPINAFYSSGSAAPRTNTNNQVMENEVFDHFNLSLAAHGVLLEANNGDWQIVRNSFYETSTFSPVAAVAQSAIRINNTGVNGTIVRGNHIGGSSAFATGTSFTKSSSNSNPFYGIRIQAGATTPTKVDSNVIGNISWTNSTGNSWFGIDVTSGWVDIGLQYGNQIGGSGAAISMNQTTATTTSNLYGINLSGAGQSRIRHNVLSHIDLNASISGTTFWGIHVNSTGNVDVDSNTISNITTSASSLSLAANLYGIYKTATIGTTNIRGNMIGSSSVANSLHASSSSTGAAQLVYGIQSLGTGMVTISGNTIANLTNATTNVTTTTTGLINGIASTAGTNLIENNVIRDLSIANANNTSFNLSSITGIMLTGATLKTVRNNTVFNLQNTFSNFTGHIYGIYFTGNTGANNGVYRNFVHSLTVPNNTTATAANIYGIRQVSNGDATIANNIVALQGSNTATLHGLFDNSSSGTCNVYHNTLYIGGNAGAGGAPSYSLWSNATTAIEDYRNNMLVNVRTGGTGKHYGIRLAGTTSLTINNNNYFIGPGGFTGLLSIDRSTLANWQAATNQDQNSIALDPSFPQPGGSLATDYFPQNQDPSMRGAILPAVTEDYQTTTRTSYAIGAFEYPLAIWWVGGNGVQPKAWNNMSNWSPAQIPGPTDLIWVQPNGNGHHPILDQNRTIYRMDFQGSGKKVELGNFNLTLTDTLLGTNAANYVQTNGTGKLVRNLNDGEAFIFPVGRASFNPVTITNRTGTADTLAVRVMDAVYVNGSSGTQIQTPHVRVTWDISKTNGTAAAGQGVDFKFQWHASQESAGMSDYVLNHHDGNVWEIPTAMGAPTLIGTQDKFFTVPQYQGTFSPFAIGDNPTSPLPITLTAFNAQCKDGQVLLNWETEAEINNAFFHIEKSTDLLHWDSISTVEGAGNSATPLFYAYLDQNRPEGVLYYRLSQEDFDGSTTYFAPIAVSCDGNQSKQVRVYPNPTTEVVFIECTGIPGEGKGEVKLLDMQGRVWLSQPVQWSAGSQTLEIKVQDLPSGVYHVQLMHAGERWPAMRLVVH